MVPRVYRLNLATLPAVRYNFRGKECDSEIRRRDAEEANEDEK